MNHLFSSFKLFLALWRLRLSHSAAKRAEASPGYIRTSSKHELEGHQKIEEKGIFSNFHMKNLFNSLKHGTKDGSSAQRAHRSLIQNQLFRAFPNSCSSIIALPKCWLRVSLAEFDPLLVYLLLVAKPLQALAPCRKNWMVRPHIFWCVSRGWLDPHWLVANAGGVYWKSIKPNALCQQSESEHAKPDVL